MSTVTPSPEQTGAVRATPPRRSRTPLFLLLALFGAVILAGVLYLLLHGNSSDEPSNKRVADTGTLPPSAQPSTAPSVNGGGGSVASTGSVSGLSASPAPSASSAPAASSTASSSGTVVGWVGGAGRAPAKATGGLAKEGSVGTVLFDYNSASLDADARQVVVAVAGELKKQKPSSVQVTGYTDNIGTPGYNLGLSARRAKAVADVLNSELPPGWVVSTGKGWSNPVASNASDNTRALNRRTTITTT